MRVEIYTDGACSGNGTKNAPGGWGYYMRAMTSRGGTKKIVGEKTDKGNKLGTTNNEMELTAVLEALRALKPDSAGKCNVHIYTDSKYVIGCLEEWLANWKRNGWRNSSGDPVLNKQLIQEIDTLCNLYGGPGRENLTFHWVRGHAGHPINTRVDELAVAAKLELIAFNPKP